VIEITVPCADDFLQSADLLQVPANYGSYRILGGSCQSGAPPGKERCVTHPEAQSAEPVCLAEQLAERKKARTLFGPGFESLTAEGSSKHSAVLT